ncbi:MAG: hypothetical protein H6953_07045 [Chromatiaceae bacterium]|nr:hypothetical protein [Chromatiaceae bacterium]
MLAYCENPPTDTLLLVSLPKLDRQQQQAKWFQALETAGVVVSVWPIEARRLPMWIEQRLRAAGILPTGEAVSLLAERTEGNLLAARQEIESCCCCTAPAPGRYAAHRRSDRQCPFRRVRTGRQYVTGEAERCLHILDGLRSGCSRARRALGTAPRGTQPRTDHRGYCARGRDRYGIAAHACSAAGQTWSARRSAGCAPHNGWRCSTVVT